MANKHYPKTLSFSSTIPFDEPLSYMPEHTITGALTFVKDTTDAQPGFGTMVRLVADGSHTPDLSDFALTGQGAWVNTASTVNQLFFFYDGSQYCVIISQPGTGGTGGSLIPLSTPGSFTATPSGADVNLTWSDVANDQGYEIYWNAVNDFGSAGLATTTAANATSYSKTGLSNGPWYFWIKAVGDGVTYSDSSTASANATVSGGLSALSTPTLTATVISSSEIDLSWTNVANESSYKLEWSPNGTSGWTQIGGTIAANTTTYNHTGLTAATHYYYRVTAVGDGVSYSDSGYGTDDDTTSAASDTDATAYITAQETVDSITIDTTNRNAINQLFMDLKAGSNPFAQGKALYLFYGTTILNALSPTNDDAHFRATNVNGGVIDATGLTLDGVNDYLNTHINPSTNLATHSESYAWYNGIDANSGCDIGVYVGSTGTALFSRSSGNFLMRIAQAGDINTGANAASTGRYVLSLRSTDIGGSTYSRRILKNGSQIYENPAPADSPTNGLLTIGAYNISGGGSLGTPGGYRNARYGIFWIGLELTNTQMADLDTAISNFITATSRT